MMKKESRKVREKRQEKVGEEKTRDANDKKEDCNVDFKKKP
jgi:hypothetical protein